MTIDEELAAGTRPRDVVDAAGRWLGAALAPAGFAWRPRPRRLQREAGPLLHQIHVQPGRHNRTGRLITIDTVLNVREAALRAWRLANEDRVVPPIDDLVCGHPLGYGSGRANSYRYGSYEDGVIDLTEPPERVPTLEAFAAMARQAVLPWFDEASEPDTIVGSPAGDHTNRPDALVEWLVSRGRADLVGRYVSGRLARQPGARSGYETGRSAARRGVPPTRLNPAELLGWSVERLTGPGSEAKRPRRDHDARGNVR